jgi:NADPH:quinone reductase-like Zn-dependent oxidoreductase
VIGPRVVLYPGVSCGHCPQCLVGDDPLCAEYGIRGETFSGGAAEYVVAPAHEAVPLPDNLDWATAGSFGLTFMTAYHMLFSRGHLQPGEWALIHAAGSGVSSSAIQLARMIGAHVITTVGSHEKAKRAEVFNIDHIVNYKETDFAKEVWSITGKRGVDLIVDHIGADTFEGNLRSLAKGGRLVTCGTTSGPIVQCNLAMVFFKGLSILGSTMGSRAEFLKCMDLVSRGFVGPVIDRTLPFDKLRDAHSHLESRQVFGKVAIGFEK